MMYGITNVSAASQGGDGPSQAEIEAITQEIEAIKEVNESQQDDIDVLKDAGSGGKYIGGTALSSEATGTDSKSQYAVLKKTASGSSQALFAIASKFPPGTYSIMLRMKVSNITVADNLVDIVAKVSSASGTQLKEVYIKPSMFSAADKFQTIGFVVDFDAGKDNSLYLAATLLACSTTVAVTIDYVLIAPAYTAVSSIA